MYIKLKEIYPSIISQFKQEWCKNKLQLPFDFCIPEYKIIIELDGPHHFKQISNWRCPEEQHKVDIFKEKSANEHGYSTIRLIQEDVFYNKYNWLTKLQMHINEIKEQEIICNIYMCKNDEYKLFK